MGIFDMSIPSARISALLIVLGLWASYGHAQATDIPARLSLADSIRLAIERNPILAAAKNEIRASEGDKVAADRRFNPTFSLQFEDLPLSPNPGPFFSVQEITSRVDYEIEMGGRRQLRTEAANQALEAQILLYKNQVRLLRLQVQQAFYQTVLAKSCLETSQSILDQSERMIQLNQVRFRQGDISALDLNRIEVEKLKFQDDVFQADLALRNAKSSLLALLNGPDLSQDIEVEGALQINLQDPEPGLPPSIPVEELIQIALKQRPDLRARLQAGKQADTELRLQRSIRSPSITVGGGYKRNLYENSVVFGISIPLKIFNRNEGGIIRAEAEHARSSNLAAALRNEIQLDVQKAFNAVEINRQRVEYIRTRQLKKVEDARRVTLESYNLGGSTLIDLLDAQRTYRDTLRIFNQALFEERISLFELSTSIALGVQ